MAAYATPDSTQKQCAECLIDGEERLDDKGGSPGIVGDLLMGDPDVVKVFESLRSLAQGETKIYMESQTEPHDMGVMPAELQGGSIFRKGV